MPWLVLHIMWACVSSQLLIHNHKMELTKFEIRVLLKHYWKQDRRICEVEGGVVSVRVAQRWIQSFKPGEENTEDLPRSGRSKLWGYCCCLLFNDGHVLQLRSETVAIHRWMIHGLDDIWWPYDNQDWMWPKFPDICLMVGAKGDWDFQIFDLVKIPDGTDI